MVIVESGTTYIEKVRAARAGHDAFAVQFYLQRTLAGVQLHPPDLPASAIVCIRALRDPLPGALRYQQSGMHVTSTWAQAVATMMAELVRNAARPIRGAVPATAQAVLFADRAELLACLASDWCDDRIGTRWWWPSLLKTADIPAAVVPTWLDAPQYGPVALEYLAKRGQAEAFVSRWLDREVRIFLQRICRSFALHSLAAIVDTLADHDSDVAHASTDGQPVQLPLHGPGIQYPSAPWQRWVPESLNSALSLAQQCVLGIGLLLQRAPGVVRTRAFAHEVLQWQQAMLSAAQKDRHDMTPYTLAQTPDQTGSGDGNSIVETDPQRLGYNVRRNGVSTPTSTQGSKDRTSHGLHSGNRADVSEDESSPRLDPNGSAAGSIQDAEQSDADRTLPSSERIRFPSPTRTTAFDTDHSSLAPASTAAAPEQRQPVDTAALPAAERVDRSAATRGLLEAQIGTEQGGIFYLINVGLFLDLYGDFTMPTWPGISLPIWDFVALVGRRLIGDVIKRDPIWSLLVRLAGRSIDEAPGGDFDPPDQWRLPVAWLAPFEAHGRWHWAARDGRLRVQHSAQFLILDVPLNAADPIRQLKDELCAYSVPDLDWEAMDESLIQHPAATSQKPLERWLDWLVSYVRARLSRALGIAVDAVPRVLCEHHARVLVTPTHVDVMLSLAKLPIEIRLAGLDRDPGWVPAAGRAITFHFA